MTKTKKEYQKLYDRLEPYIEKYSYSFYCLNEDDNKYFSLALGADILMSIESILVNMIKDNPYSQGVDSSCRTIMEALLILKMDEVGDISTDQKKLFRITPVVMEYHNAYPDLNDCLKDVNAHAQKKPNFKKRTQTMDACLAFINNYFGLADDLKIGWYSEVLNDPNLYLRKQTNYKKPFSHSKNIKQEHKYDIQINNQAYVYHFFSHMIHPWCESDENKLNDIMNERDQYIDAVLTRAIEYVDNTYPVINESGIQNGLKKKLWRTMHDTDLQNVVLSCQELGKALEVKYKIPHFVCDRIGYLVKDMTIFSSILEVRDAVSKFKSFIEMISLLMYLISLDNGKDKENMIDCYVLLSRFTRLNIKSEPTVGKIKSRQDVQMVPLSSLEKVFNSFYKKKYKIGDFDAFLWIIKDKEPFYAFGNDVGSLTDLVKTQTSNHYPYGGFIKYNEIMESYKFSNYIEHATGYASQSPYYSDHTCCYGCVRLSLQILNDLMNSYLDDYKTKYEDSFLVLCQEAFLNEIVYETKYFGGNGIGQLNGKEATKKAQPVLNLISHATFNQLKNTNNEFIRLIIIALQKSVK